MINISVKMFIPPLLNSTSLSLCAYKYIFGPPLILTQDKTSFLWTYTVILLCSQNSIISTWHPFPRPTLKIRKHQALQRPKLAGTKDVLKISRIPSYSITKLWHLDIYFMWILT